MSLWQAEQVWKLDQQMKAGAKYRAPGQPINSKGRDKEYQPDDQSHPVNGGCQRWQPEALVGVENAREQTAGAEDRGSDQQDPEQVGC